MAAVVGVVEVAVRDGDEAIGSKLPAFEAADADFASGAAGASVCAGEGPVIVGVLCMDAEIVHGDTEVRESGHERTRDFGDGIATDSGRSVVHGKGA